MEKRKMNIDVHVICWNEEKNAYTAEPFAYDLPYGSYTIRESKTNESYQRTDKNEHIFEVREDGVIVSYEDEAWSEALTFGTYVYRSDVVGTKIADCSSERFSYVPFRITSLTTGESHVVVTDKNGFFSTKDRRTKDGLEADEVGSPERAINPFDDLIRMAEEKIVPTYEELKARADDILMGVWFGRGEFDSEAEQVDNAGALPYDSYMIEELPCEQNDGYIPQSFRFTVDQKSRNGLIDLATITDDRVPVDPEPEPEPEPEPDPEPEPEPEPEVPGVPNTENPKEEPIKETLVVKKETPAPIKIDAPKTGDPYNLSNYTVLGGVTFITACAAALSRRRRR